MVVRELITLLGFDLKDGPLQKYDKQIDSTKAKSNGLSTAAKGVGIAWKVAAAAVAVGVGWISKNIISATVEMEGYRTQLQAFTGDADSAAAALAELRDKTIDPLFGTGNLVNAYKQLRTVGMGAEDTSRMIDVLGDVANGSAENFNSLNNILLRVKTTGKINDGTMRQLAMAGFGAQDMAQGLGISVERLNADLAAGKIGFNDLTRAMEGATKEGGRFYMNAANQALTLGGSLKILKSLLSDIGEAIGTKVAPALANMIAYVTNLIKLGKNGLVDFGAKAFDYLIHIIAQVIIFFEVLQMRMKKYGGAFTPLKAIFADVFDFLKAVARSAYPFLMNLAQLFLVAFKPIQAFVKPILEALKPIIQKVFGFLSRIVEGLIPKVNGLTPVFEKLGKFVGSIIEPALKLALAIRGVNTAIAIGKGAVAAFGTAQKIASGLSLVFSGNLMKMSMGFQSLGIGQQAAMRLTETFGLLTGKVSLATAAANKNKLAMLAQAAIAVKAKIAILAKAAAEKIAAVATKIWSGIQAVFNAIMAVNPIVLIIIGIMALIAAVVLLIKHWDKIGPAIMKVFAAIGNFFKKIGSAIAGFFKMIWNAVVSVFNKVAGFIKKNAVNILNAILMILFFPAGVIMAVVRLIIKHWDTIKAALVKVFNFVAEKAKAIWGGIVNIVKAVVDRIKAVWESVTGFFGGIWGGIKNIAGKAWEGIKNVAGKAWDGMKNTAGQTLENMKQGWSMYKETAGKAWDGIKNVASKAWDGIKTGAAAAGNFLKNRWEDLKAAGKRTFDFVDNISGGALTRLKDGFFNAINNIKAFFAGFWGALKEGPTATIEFIKNAIIGLFDYIKEKIIGFINAISEGFSRIKTVFGNVFTAIWNKVTTIFRKVVDFVKKNALNILNVLLYVFFFIPGIVMTVVRLVIKHWGTIKGALVKVFTFVVGKVKQVWGKIINIVKAIIDKIKQIWESIVGVISRVIERVKSVWETIWNAIVGVVQIVVEKIKAMWSGFGIFLSGLWEGIKNITAMVWDGIKNIFFGVVDAIKNIWTGIIGFFTGLWEALKQGPTEALQYIKNAFFALFDVIKEKFFAFINVIKEGWDKVKGFFGGIKDAVVNVVTGGGNTSGATPVNDMIVTPDGNYSTHPDDYIMAMKKPGDLIDALMKYLAGPQLAYAGARGGSLAGSAMKSAATNNNYHSSTTSNESHISAPINVSVNASGMSPEMASMAVQRGVEDALREAISGARGTIPSPEKEKLMGIVSFTYQKTPKSIGGFEIDVILSERYGFSNSVTDIPVEDGSNINDHVVSESVTVSIQAFIGRAKYEVWDGDIPESVSDLPADDPKARIKQSYLELKRLKDDGQPLTVVLGLDTFENMVITSFEIDRDVQTGADLPFSMSFKQVRVIKSESTTINSSTGGGDQTAGTANGGVQGTSSPNQQNNRMKEEWRQSVQSGLTTPAEYMEKWGVPYPQ